MVTISSGVWTNTNPSQHNKEDRTARCFQPADKRGLHIVQQHAALQAAGLHRHPDKRGCSQYCADWVHDLVPNSLLSLHCHPTQTQSVLQQLCKCPVDLLFD